MHSAALRGDRLALCHTSLDVHRLALSRPPSPSPQLLPVTDGGAPARPIEKTNPNPRLRMSSALPATAPPLDDEDFLREILLRLPPNPSSLPRASVVCKRWRSILSDAKFLRRFRKHHRKPPLLGFFPSSVVRKHVFTPVLESPDRIPATRFSVLLSRGYSDEWDFHGCRHGLCVLTNKSRRELVVWDPLTGQQHRVPFPPGIPTDEWYICLQAVVQCVSADDGLVRRIHADISLSL